MRFSLACLLVAIASVSCGGPYAGGGGGGGYAGAAPSGGSYSRGGAPVGGAPISYQGPVQVAPASAPVQAPVGGGVVGGAPISYQSTGSAPLVQAPAGGAAAPGAAPTIVGGAPIGSGGVGGGAGGGFSGGCNGPSCGGPDFNPILLQGNKGYPGLRARINSRAFQYASGMIGNLLNSEIKKARIPPISQCIPQVQGCVQIYNLYVSRYRCPQRVVLYPAAPNRLVLQVQNVDIGVTGNLGGQIVVLVPIALTGIVQLNLHQVTVTVALAVERSSTGSPYLRVESCSVNIGYADAYIEQGGLIGDIVNSQFRSRISQQVREMVPGKICAQLPTIVNEKLNSKLAGLPQTIALTQMASMFGGALGLGGGGPSPSSQYCSSVCTKAAGVSSSAFSTDSAASTSIVSPAGTPEIPTDAYGGQSAAPARKVVAARAASAPQYQTTQNRQVFAAPQQRTTPQRVFRAVVAPQQTAAVPFRQAAQQQQFVPQQRALVQRSVYPNQQHYYQQAFYRGRRSYYYRPRVARSTDSSFSALQKAALIQKFDEALNEWGVPDADEELHHSIVKRIKRQGVSRTAGVPHAIYKKSQVVQPMLRPIPAVARVARAGYSASGGLAPVSGPVLAPPPAVPGAPAPQLVAPNPDLCAKCPAAGGSQDPAGFLKEVAAHLDLSKLNDMYLSLQLMSTYATSNDFTVDLTGEFSPYGQGGTPFGAFPTQFPSAYGSQMAEFIVSDYTLNSLFYHMHRKGFISFRIGPETPKIGDLLKTTCSDDEDEELEDHGVELDEEDEERRLKRRRRIAAHQASHKLSYKARLHGVALIANASRLKRQDDDEGGGLADLGICFGDILPAVREQYPNKKINIHIHTVRAPSVLLSQQRGGMATIDLIADADIYIDGTNTRVGTITIAAVVEITARVTGNRISGQAQITQLKLTDRTGSLGLPQDALDNLGNLGKELLQKLANDALGKGIAINIPSNTGLPINIINPQVQIVEHGLHISTDLTINPSALGMLGGGGC